jgi:hypothetical protein
MSSKTFFAVLVTTLCAAAAACGTADNGGKSASPADAQVPATAATSEPEAKGDSPAPMSPPLISIPRPPGPGTAPAADVPSGGPCATDADCVAATCCHPKTCVAKAQAPSCEGMMCTLDCRAGTMDCGGGKCVCRDGACASELKKPGYVKGVEEAIKPQ